MNHERNSTGPPVNTSAASTHYESGDLHAGTQPSTNRPLVKPRRVVCNKNAASSGLGDARIHYRQTAKPGAGSDPYAGRRGSGLDAARVEIERVPVPRRTRKRISFGNTINVAWDIAFCPFQSCDQFFFFVARRLRGLSSTKLQSTPPAHGSYTAIVRKPMATGPLT